MKRPTWVFVLLMVFGMAPAAWAGPAEEIAQIGAERGKAFREGNLDRMMADYADNAVLISARDSFRVEGKEAIRGYYAKFFEQFPTRAAFGRQPSTRVYGNDTVVVQNAYLHLRLVDRAGQVTDLFTRISQTWVRQAGQWWLVDQHLSRLP